MTTPLLEPMTVGGILDRTFRLYRENVLRYIAIVAVIEIPIGLVLMVASALFYSSLLPIREAGDDPARPNVALMLTGSAALMFGAFLGVIGQHLANAALIRSVSESYLGGDATVGQAYRFILPRIGWILLAALLISLATGVGLLFCVVPGVLVALFFGLTMPAIVTENLNTFDGMKRSWSLVSGNLGKVFLVGLIVFLINFVIGLLFGAVGSLTAVLALAKNPVAGQVLQQTISVVPQVLTMPIGAAAMILLYYDLRIRKEGFDLEMLARSLGEGGATDAPGA